MLASGRLRKKRRGQENKKESIVAKTDKKLSVKHLFIPTRVK